MDSQRLRGAEVSVERAKALLSILYFSFTQKRNRIKNKMS